MPANYTPFRTASKIKTLAQRGLIDPAPYYILKPIPRYKATKQQRLAYSHVHGLGTWMVDISFFRNKGEVIQGMDDANAAGGFADEEEEMAALSQSFETPTGWRILICIHCNSRYVYAKLLRDTTAKSIQPVLKTISQSSMPCDTIISDADRSIADAIRRVPKIKQHIVHNMSDNNYTNHSMLAIIDRFTRTLRDMLFTAQVDLTPETLAELLNIYNNTPHSTLTKVMGFETTPTDMITHLPLQEEYVRRVMVSNMSKYGALTNTYRVGDIVYVYQPHTPFVKRRNTVMDYPYRITAIKGGRYYLQCLNDGSEIQRPRSYLIKP